jgi:hypothetical protein
MKIIGLGVQGSTFRVILVDISGYSRIPRMKFRLVRTVNKLK